jgi:integrase
MRDATLVSVLAYAGLRPGEALALRWRDIGEQTILIEKALSLGQETSTKTRRMRSVRLLTPLATDLAEWRMASGRPDDSALVFPTRVGSPWAETDWRNWRKRRFNEAANAAGIKARPYDLRHSFASLLFAERRNPAEIAEQLGHSLQTLFGTYTHVIEELRGQDRVKAEDVIRTARRGKDVAQKLPEPAEANSGGAL